MASDEKTSWQGLWKARKSVYRSQVIRKKDIPPFARLIVRYNKFYSADSQRPRFVFCFANGEAEKAITMERKFEEGFEEYFEEGTALCKYDEENGTYYTMDDERLYTRDEVQRAINGATRSALSGYADNIVEDYI